MGTEIIPLLLIAWSFLISAILIGLSTLTRPIGRRGFAVRVTLLMAAWCLWYLWSTWEYANRQSGIDYWPQHNVQFFLYTTSLVGLPLSYWTAKFLIHLGKSHWWALTLELAKISAMALAMIIFSIMVQSSGSEMESDFEALLRERGMSDEEINKIIGN